MNFERVDKIDKMLPLNFIHSIKVFGGGGGVLHLHLLFYEIVYRL